MISTTTSTMRISFSPPQMITVEDTDLQIVYADFATNKDL